MNLSRLAGLPGSVELFDLSKDPGEKNNIADANPEKVTELKNKMIAISKEMAPPLLIMEAIKLTFGVPPEALAPASAVFSPPTAVFNRNDAYVWWSYVQGADWRHPKGPARSIEGLAKHPVVHIGYEDAVAYAQWAGKELPSEAEFEFAARGGLDGKPYVWGDELHPGGRMMANTWQGEFPWENACDDGYYWTSPVGSYPANGYGLYDMAGNVWQWTSDWY